MTKAFEFATAAPGGLVLLSTSEISGSPTSVQFLTGNGVVFDDTYQGYVFKLNKVEHNSGTPDLRVELYDGSFWQIGSTYNCILHFIQGSTGSWSGTTQNNCHRLVNATNTGDGAGVYGEFTLHEPWLTDDLVSMSSMCVYRNGAGILSKCWSHSEFTNYINLAGIRFIWSNATAFTGGTITMYGVKK